MVSQPVVLGNQAEPKSSFMVLACHYCSNEGAFSAVLPLEVCRQGVGLGQPNHCGLPNIAMYC